MMRLSRTLPRSAISVTGAWRLPSWRYTVSIAWRWSAMCSWGWITRGRSATPARRGTAALPLMPADSGHTGRSLSGENKEDENLKLSAKGQRMY